MRELLKTIELSIQGGNDQIMVIAYGNLAEALMAQEQLDEALAMAERAVSEARRRQLADLDVSQLLHTLAKVHSRRSERELADRTFAEAEVMLRQCGDIVKLSRLLSDYGHSLISWHDFDRACDKLSEATAILNPRLKSYAVI